MQYLRENNIGNTVMNKLQGVIHEIKDMEHTHPQLAQM
jgi:hypothetical protein